MAKIQNKEVSEETYVAVSNYINSCIVAGFMPSTKELCDKYSITYSQVNLIAKRMELTQ